MRDQPSPRSDCRAMANSWSCGMPFRSSKRCGETAVILVGQHWNSSLVDWVFVQCVFCTAWCNEWLKSLDFVFVHFAFSHFHMAWLEPHRLRLTMKNWKLPAYRQIQMPREPRNIWFAYFASLMSRAGNCQHYGRQTRWWHSGVLAGCHRRPEAQENRKCLWWHSKPCVDSFPPFITGKGRATAIDSPWTGNRELPGSCLADRKA